MNCIIVDDDKMCCKVLEGFVEKYSTLTSLGSFYSAFEARNFLTTHPAMDIVFLDVVMPGFDGFNFLHSLDAHNTPNIIMVSSKSDFAFDAYDFNVVDYLLKPVDYARFCRAVDKVARFFLKREIADVGDSEIFVKTASSLVKIRYKDIIFIEALENYVCMNTATDKYTVHFTMKALEQQLPDSLFIRTHRSYIVNRNMVHAITNSSVEVSLGEEVKSIPVGKAFKDNLLKELKVMVK